MPSVKLNFEEPTVKVLMLKGNDGFSPIVATHRDGTTVTVTVTDAHGEHNFDIEDGFSPVLTWSKVNGVTTVNVTSAVGTRSFEIHDGVDLTGGVPTNGVIGWDSTATIPNGYQEITTDFTTLDKVYPVGSIYMSVNSTSPATLFGGTWQQIKDKFLLASGNTYGAGTTGGEAAHTLTVDEMPKTRFRIPHVSNYDSCAITGYSETRESMGVEGAPTSVQNEGWHRLSTGNGYAHNNMPPYLAVYIWKRTA